MDTTHAQDATLPGQTDALPTAIESQENGDTPAVAEAAKEQAPTTESSNPKSDNPHWKPRAPRMVGPDGQLLSRNATKKLIKQQEFLERKPLMKQQEKLKRKKKQQERREAIEKGLIEPKRRKLDPTQSGITIGIDMSFDDHMLEKEVKSMVDQIKRCYSFNKGCDKIVHLALTSFTGKSRVEFAKRAHGFELWRNFTYHDESLEKVWPSPEIPGKERMESIKKLQAIAAEKSEAAKAKALAAQAQAAAAAATQGGSQTEQQTTVESPAQSLTEAEIKALEQERLVREENLATIPAVNKIVYLSADSPNTITQLDPGTCYVMGGIVDKNRYPFLCQNKAEALGIETAQLPIGEYIQMSSRRVLTVNQVFEILLHFIECGDWKEAFLKVIPQRKLEEKQRIRRGTAAWREKYGTEGKSRPSNSSGANSGDDHEDDDEDGDEDNYDSDEEGDKEEKVQDSTGQGN